jgi:hypothetical protein
MGLALVTRIPSLVEAQIAAGALRSAGIHAQVFDAWIGAMEAPVVEGLGGYRIMAPEGEVAAARDVLSALRANPQPLDGDPVSPWGPAPPARSWPARWPGVRILVLVTLVFPIALAVVRTLARWMLRE